jgi:hypothetical protein
MLKYILKKMKAMMWAGSIWVSIRLEGPIKHKNKASLFEKAGNFSSI